MAEEIKRDASRQKRKLKTGCFIAPLVVLAILYALSRLIVFTPANAIKIKTAIENTATKALHEELRLGRVYFDLLGRLIINTPRLGRADKPMLVADRIVAPISIPNAIRGARTGEYGKAVKTIRIIAPDIHLERRADCVWSFDNLIEGGGATSRGAQIPELNIMLENATLAMRDHCARAPYPVTRFALSNLHGPIHISPQTVITLNLKAPDTTYGTGFGADVRFDPASGWRLSITYDRLDPAVIGRFFGSNTFSISGGHMPLTFFAEAAYTRVGHSPNYSWGGEASLTGQTIDYSPWKLHLTNARGDVEFGPDMISVKKGRARFAGGTARVSGSYTRMGADTIGAAIDFAGIDLARVPMMPVAFKKANARGRATGSLMIDGPVASPRVLTRFAATSPSFMKTPADSLAATVKYEGSLITVTGAKLAIGGAKATIDGSYDTDSAKWQARAALDGIDIHTAVPYLPPSRFIPRRGSITGDISIEGTASDVSSATFIVQGRGLATAELDNIALEAAAGYSDGTFDIKNLTLKNSDIFLIADGTAARDHIEIAVHALSMKTADLLYLAGREDISSSGRLRFRGNVTGDFDKPVFAATVSASPLKFSSIALDHMTGRVIVSPYKLLLDNMRLTSHGDTHEVNGLISLRDKTLDITASLKNASLPGLASTIREISGGKASLKYDVDGNIDATIRATGRLAQPDIAASLNGKALRFEKERIPSASAQLAWSRDRLSCEATALAAGGTIKLKGSTGDDDTISAQFTGSGIDIEAISSIAPYVKGATGSADISGSISGTISDPVVTAGFHSAGTQYNGITFTTSRAQFTYSDKLASITGLTLKNGAENYSFDMKYDFASKLLDISGSITDGHLATLVAVQPYSLPSAATGSIEGRFRIFSRAGDLSGAVQFTGKDIHIGEYPIADFAMEGGFEGKSFNITKFEAANETALVQANGLVNLHTGDFTTMNIDAHGIELQSLSDLGFFHVPFAGMADIVIGLVGDDSSDTLAGSIEIYTPEAFGLKFDRARGQFEFNGDALTILNLQFLKGQSKFSISANIPARKNSTSNFEIIARTDNLSLPILNPILARYGVTLDGSLDFRNVRITGTPKAPVITGNILIANATLKHKDITQPVTALAGDLVFDRDAIRIKKLQGSLEGRPIRINGGLSFKGLRLDSYDFELYDVDSLNITYRENIFKGKIDVKNLAFRGDSTKAEIYGRAGRPPTITAHDGNFTIPQASPAPATPATPFPLALRSFIINVSDNINIRNKGGNLNLNDTQGRITIAGTLAKPEIKGWLTSSRGTLSYIGNNFKLQDDAVIGFTSFEGIGIVPMFYMKTLARVSGTDITMELSGPMIDIDQSPAFRERCSDTGTDISGIDTISTPKATALSMGTITLGADSDITIPVCPQRNFIAYENNISSAHQYSDQEIMQKLTHTENLITGERYTMQNIQPVVAGFVSPIVGSVIERTTTIENFSINLDPNKDVLVQFEKHLNNRISIKYERLFSDSIEENLEARYKFRKRSYLKWGIDQDSQSNYQLEYQLRF